MAKTLKLQPPKAEPLPVEGPDGDIIGYVTDPRDLGTGVHAKMARVSEKLDGGWSVAFEKYGTGLIVEIDSMWRSIFRAAPGHEEEADRITAGQMLDLIGQVADLLETPARRRARRKAT